MPEDFTRVVGAILDETGNISKLILEQEDHTQREVEIGPSTEGLGDTLFAAFEAGGLVINSQNNDVPLDAIYNSLDGGTSLVLDTETGVITAQRPCMVDGYVFSFVNPAASNGDRGAFRAKVNNTGFGVYSFAMDQQHLDAGLIWRLNSPLVLSEGDQVVLQASKFDATAFTVTYAEFYLVVTNLL